jgi:hypothetical protein
MIALAWLAAVAIAVVGPVPADSPSPPATVVSAKPLPLVLDVVGLDAAEVESAMALRLGDRELLGPHEFGPDDDVDYAAVRRQSDGSLAITLITRDGRAYDRTLPAEQVQSVRAVAGVLTNLVFATEAGTTPPDRTNVPIPVPAPPAVEPPKPTPTPPARKPAPKPEPSATPPPPAPRWELGLAPSGAVIVGVAPSTSGSALAAGSGALALDVRAPVGAVVSAGVRVGGRARDPLALLRTRVELGAGYDWRWRNAELLLVGAMSVELWRARMDGNVVELQVGGSEASRPVLLGAFARVSPGWRLPAKRPGAPSLRLGARADIGGSAALGRGGHTIDIGIAQPDGSREGSMRVGGFEIGVGLELALWFSL